MTILTSIISPFHLIELFFPSHCIFLSFILPGNKLLLGLRLRQQLFNSDIPSLN